MFFMCSSNGGIVNICIHFSGNITISDDVILNVDSDLNGDSPQFTLTCISTGGPATTVTWTRDSGEVVGDTETVLNDLVTARYTHTLNVTERLVGLYTCTVTNNKPSTASATITVQGIDVYHVHINFCFISVPGASPPTDLTAVQTGPTSINVSWTPPTPLGNTTGYIIYYTNDDSVDIDDSSTVAHTLTGLQNGYTYTISIVATSSSDLPSESVLADMTVGLSESNILYNNIQ